MNRKAMCLSPVPVVLDRSSLFFAVCTVLRGRSVVCSFVGIVVVVRTRLLHLRCLVQGMHSLVQRLQISNVLQCRCIGMLVRSSTYKTACSRYMPVVSPVVAGDPCADLPVVRLICSLEWIHLDRVSKTLVKLPSFTTPFPLTIRTVNEKRSKWGILSQDLGEGSKKEHTKRRTNSVFHSPWKKCQRWYCTTRTKARATIQVKEKPGSRWKGTRSTRQGPGGS